MGDVIGSRSTSESEMSEKRNSDLFGEKMDPCKRVKMWDHDSVCHSEEMAESNRGFLSLNKDTSHEPGIITLDLNSEFPIPNDSAKMDHDPNFDHSKGFGLDLNADDKSNSPTEGPLFPFKKLQHLKSGDVSECGSSTGPLEDKDSMRVWKEMKQNGFLSSSHASIAVPKQRGRKSKNESLKKKMELAKKEQVDRFAKIAAPSGLLNELNPGIINHVRNRKQVHSIIEALVRLEKDEKKQGVSSRSFERGDRGSGLGRWFLDKSSFTLPKKHEREDDVLALKLGSSTIKGSENISSLCDDDMSANLSSVSSLSVKGANVAFHWLELLQQDIKGRLAALRRSKNRVQSVINTELPLLMTQEFNNQENNPQVANNFSDGCSLSENFDAHRVKWSGLFDQMEKALFEEEKQLEIWLQQVKEMQLQCERGLHQFNPHPVLFSQRPGTSETDHRRVDVAKSERELAVRAAAASIYSTCNFLSSSQNLHCS